jgi:hypothetical protein
LPPPYEYETEKPPIDIIIGRGGMAQLLEMGVDIRDLEATWSNELETYRESCQRFFLYEG